MPDRELPTIREPILRGQATGERVSSDARVSIIPRGTDGRSIITADSFPITQTPNLDSLNSWLVQNASKDLQVPWNPNTNQAAVISPSMPADFKGNGDPTLTLSDIFRNIPFGNTNSPLQTGQALVPVTSTSGGGNWILILIVVAIGGAAFWYYYKKKNN